MSRSVEHRELVKFKYQDRNAKFPDPLLRLIFSIPYSFTQVCSRIRYIVAIPIPPASPPNSAELRFGAVQLLTSAHHHA